MLQNILQTQVKKDLTLHLISQLQLNLSLSTFRLERPWESLHCIYLCLRAVGKRDVCLGV